MARRFADSDGVSFTPAESFRDAAGICFVNRVRVWKFYLDPLCIQCNFRDLLSEPQPPRLKEINRALGRAREERRAFWLSGKISQRGEIPTLLISLRRLSDLAYRDVISKLQMQTANYKTVRSPPAWRNLSSRTS